jgi:MOSC domain-containing protein YiiM
MSDAKDHAPARVLSVNLGALRPHPTKPSMETGIDKRPTAEPVLVRAPGSQEGGLGSGLVGDRIGDRSVHGGDEQAVYAYAREDLDRWEAFLGRTLPPGSFGENLTTLGIDVNDARIGERWRVGTDLELEVTAPRIPCSTFRSWIDRAGWLREFTLAAVPGTYLCVVREGTVRAGDPITVSYRPGSGPTVADYFRSEMNLAPDDRSPLDDSDESHQGSGDRRTSASRYAVPIDDLVREAHVSIDEQTELVDTRQVDTNEPTEEERQLRIAGGPV